MLLIMDRGYDVTTLVSFTLDRYFWDRSVDLGVKPVG